jgi:ATP-dependent Lon protease
VLDADHLGLQDVKKQILEFIAVGKLKDDQRVVESGESAEEGPGLAGGREISRGITSKVLCLIGPPG